MKRPSNRLATNRHTRIEATKETRGNIVAINGRVRRLT